MITLSEAKTHLRVDTDADDASLELMISAASEGVAEYLKWETQPDPVPARARQAALVLVGFMYREREGSNEYAVPAQYGYGYLPVGVASLLWPLRKPSAA